MNDIKYVMLPKLDEQPKAIKHQPWYKERLKTKYLAKNHDKFIDPKQWTFIKTGLDDFREGVPPTHKDVLIRPSDKGLKPTLIQRPKLIRQKTLLPAIRRRKLSNNKSNQMTLSQAKLERVEQLIYGLSQHPLALYSHFEEALPADLFEEIVNLLDPEMNRVASKLANEQNNDVSLSQTGKRRSHTSSMSRDSSAPIREKRTNANKLSRYPSAEESSRSFLSGEKRLTRNTYKWLLRKEEAKAHPKETDIEAKKTQAIEGHIKKVTEDFCDWVTSLGGENNIDPVTLGSLFASGHETKPALSVPIHVVDFTNIPSELRNTVSVGKMYDDDRDDRASVNEVLREPPQTPKNKNKKEPRSRYGAWYLPTKLWTPLKNDEKLIDPKFLVDKEKEIAKKRAQDMNSKLAPLHATNSFKEFVKGKTAQRVPKMLGEIEDWQHEQNIRTLSAMAVDESEEKTSEPKAVKTP